MSDEVGLTLQKAMAEEFGRDIEDYYGKERPDYIILNMSVVEELPEYTRRILVGVLEEIDETFDLSESPDKFVVLARGKNDNSKGGTAYITDPYKMKSPPKWRK